MSWDEESRQMAMRSNGKKTSFMDVIAEINNAHSVLDSYVGGLGGDLKLPERIEYVLGRIQNEVEDLHLLVRKVGAEE